MRGADGARTPSPPHPTGTNLLGPLQHCAFVEHGYLVECVGRGSDDLDSNERVAELKAWWKDYLAQA